MQRILIAYASRYGSTAEIAHTIASELDALGFETEVALANPLVQVGRYDAVIVGSPSYGRNWLPRASLFVIGNREHLAARKTPVALFTVGTLGVKNPKSALREHEQIVGTITELAPGIQLASTALFHGSFDRKNLPICLRIFDWMAATPQGDHRDWDAIRSWARSTADRFSEATDRRFGPNAVDSGESTT